MLEHHHLANLSASRTILAQQISHTIVPTTSLLLIHPISILHPKNLTHILPFQYTPTSLISLIPHPHNIILLFCPPLQKLNQPYLQLSHLLTNQPIPIIDSPIRPLHHSRHKTNPKIPTPNQEEKGATDVYNLAIPLVIVVSLMVLLVMILQQLKSNLKKTMVIMMNQMIFMRHMVNTFWG